jgi:DNA-binding beta-propeller fold protein YncE
MNPAHLPSRRDFIRAAAGAALLGPTGASALAAEKAKTKEKAGGVRRLLYVAVPGIRNYLEFGGHGVIVFDIDNGYKFVRRIPAKGLKPDGTPSNVKGIVANAATKRLYVSTLDKLACFDLLTDKILWEKSYEGGCDRMALSPDGKVMYLPSLEKEHWHVVDAMSGDVMKRLESFPRAHNTIYGLDGKHAYLAAIGTPILHVTDTATHTVSKKVGPFGSGIRPFTVNGKQTLCFVNVNGLLGFEIGDIKSGKMLHRVEVKGFQMGVPKRHGCPSHGVGLTPDEKEVWVCDAANSRMHYYDATVMPPKQIGSIEVREQPGWITFTLDGKHALPSTGDIIDVATKKIITGLTDEKGGQVHSEKMVEIHFSGNTPIKVGDQFGLGRVM